MGAWSSLKHLMALLTIIWILFLLVSSALGLLISTSLEVSSPLGQLARIVAGVVIFVVWVIVWGKLVEVWFYRFMLGERGDG
ncbi:MAG: hypothetical protein QW756_03810 [Nitrososphaerota archaeon]